MLQTHCCVRFEHITHSLCSFRTHFCVGNECTTAFEKNAVRPAVKRRRTHQGVNMNAGKRRVHSFRTHLRFFFCFLLLERECVCTVFIQVFAWTVTIVKNIK